MVIRSLTVTMKVVTTLLQAVVVSAATADEFVPTEAQMRTVCSAYHEGLSPRPVALHRIGLTEEQFFQNYEHFLCDRRTLPITHLIINYANMDLIELEKDLRYLEGLEEAIQFRLVNRVVPGRRLRGTQLDMIRVHIERLRIGPRAESDEIRGYINSIRRIKNRLIEIGARPYSDLTREEERLLGFEPINN